MREDRALDFAEYFPGGGTDSETPLAAAGATLAELSDRVVSVSQLNDTAARELFVAV